MLSHYHNSGLIPINFHYGNMAHPVSGKGFRLNSFYLGFAALSPGRRLVVDLGGSSMEGTMRKLIVAAALVFVLLPLGSVANAQMYEKDGMMLNSEGGNVFGDSNFNPMADPAFNPMADPVFNPMADPTFNPSGDAYIRDDGTMGLRSEDR